MMSGMVIMDVFLFLVLIFIMIPILSIISSLMWRVGFGILFLLAGILTLLSGFTFMAGFANLMTPGSYELGVMLMIVFIAAPITAFVVDGIDDEKPWIMLCQVVFGILAVLYLPTASMLFFAAVVFSLSGMLGEMMVDYDI